MLAKVVGAAVGAFVGAAAAGYVAKRSAPAAVMGTVRASGLLPAPPAAPAPAPAHEVLNIPTKTLSRRSTVYVPLVRFHEMMRSSEELEAFAKVVGHFDALFTMEAALHGANAVPRSAGAAAMAEAALRRAVAQIDAIVTFGDRTFPSPTRRGELVRLRDSMSAIGEEVVTSMTDTLAGSFQV